MKEPFFPDPVFAWTFFLVLAAVMAVAAVIDLRKMTIPKWLTFTTLALGVTFNVTRGAMMGASGLTKTILWLPVENSPWLGALDGLLFALVGFLIGFSMFFVMWVLGTCSGGDLKLFAALSTWSGVTLTIALLVVTIVLIIVLSVARLTWIVLRGDVQTAVRDYSIKGAARKGKRAGKQGYADAPTPRKGLTTYALPVALSVVVVFLWVFRAELRLALPNPSPAKMEMTGGKHLLARLGR
jgi:Flp pilus assembly protein protease CpaA